MTIFPEATVLTFLWSSPFCIMFVSFILFIPFVAGFSSLLQSSFRCFCQFACGFLYHHKLVLHNFCVSTTVSIAVLWGLPASWDCNHLGYMWLSLVDFSTLYLGSSVRHYNNFSNLFTLLCSCIYDTIRTLKPYIMVLLLLLQTGIAVYLQPV